MTHAKWKVIGVSHGYTKKRTKSPHSSVQLMALDRVTFTQPFGEIVGVIGGQGAGKSTLGHLLLDDFRPSEGLISGGGEQGLSLSLPNRRHDDKTGEAYVQLRATKWGVTKRRLPDLVKAIQTFSELGDQFYDRLRTYTPEEKIQLETSLILHVAPSFMYIDEALLTVKEHFYLKVMAFLKQLTELGSSVWLETAHVKRVESFCDALVWLEFGKLKQHGDVMAVLKAYDAYYFEVHRLPPSEQQAFWEEGYAAQLVPAAEATVPAVASVPLQKVSPPSTEAKESDNLSASPRTESHAPPPELSRRQRHQRSSKRPMYGVIGVGVFSALVITGLIFALPRIPKRTTPQVKLPDTRMEGRTSTVSSTLSEPMSSSTSDVTASPITHLVKDGETLSQIAAHYHVSLEALRDWNQLSSDEIYPNMVLQLIGPSVTTTTSEPVPSVAKFSHQVIPGETLLEIADRYGVSVEDIKAVNQLEGEVIYSGSTLTLPETVKQPAARPAPVAPTGSQEEATLTEHVVVKGESLYSISRYYGVDVMALQQANHLQTEQLDPGQSLIIP